MDIQVEDVKEVETLEKHTITNNKPFSVDEYEGHDKDFLSVDGDYNDGFKQLNETNGLGINCIVSKEVKDARTDVNGNKHEKLKDRIDSEVNEIKTSLENMVTYNVLCDELFDENDISLSINKIVGNLKEGESVLLPNGTYRIKNTLLLENLKNGVIIDLQGEIIVDGLLENAVVVNGGYYKLNINKLTGITPNNNFSNLVTNGLKIGSYNSYQGNININILSGFKNGILCNAIKRDNVSQGIQYNKINFNIIANCHTCIRFDLIKGEGWINENTFTGGSINGYKGIEFTGGNDDPATGYNNNKFYNIGFEGLKDNAITIQNSNGNSWINCRMLEAIDGKYFIKENSNCNWNLFVFSGLLPYEKLYIYGKLDRVIAPISINGAWTCNGFRVIRDKKYFDTEPIYNSIDKNAGRLIDINAEIIEVSSYNNEVSFKIPNNFRIEGKEITLKVTFLNPINIFNEDGTKAIANTVINSSGIWKLYYMNGVWYCYKADYNVNKLNPIYSGATTLETLVEDFKKLLSELKKSGLMKY